MVPILERTWAEVVQPLLARPKQYQVAALCYRKKGGKKEVLLITSRGTGRWILPKGWPIEGLDAPGSALQEAWEEAGVKKGKVGKSSIGSYTYAKTFDSGLTAPCRAEVYPVEVKKIVNDFPERRERNRKWVSPAKAAKMVQEPGLREILSGF